MAELIYRRGLFSVELDEKDDLAVVRLAGEFTEADSEPLTRALQGLASSHRGVIVDLRDVRYVPSRMVPPVVRAAAEARFFAAVVRPGSQRVFELVGLEKVLQIFTDEGEAHAAFLASEGT